MSEYVTTSLFDKELQLAIDGKLPENHIFSLGVPGEILQKCGFPKGQRIEMSLSRLKFKASLSRHPFELNDIFGLENSLQNPIGVFEYGDRTKSQNVIVNIKKGEKNFLAGIHFNQVKNNFDISTIRTLYPKDNMEWLNWIVQGKMVYGNKKELQALTVQQRMNVADVSGQVVQSPLHEHCLKSIENILSKFGTVNDIFTDEYPFYKDVKLHGEIEKRFFTYYTSKGNLDARELATVEADEFYIALKNNDKEKINEYMKEEFHEVNEISAEILSEYSKEKNMENTKKEITAKELQNYIENLKIKHPSKWAEAVKDDAVDLVGNYIEWYGEDATFKSENVKDLLNGAQDWKQYSQGGLGLIYDEDIAKRYSNPTELKKVGFKEVNGVLKEPLHSELKNPNPKESWLDVQARALFQASELIKKSVHDMEIKRENKIGQKSPLKKSVSQYYKVDLNAVKDAHVEARGGKDKPNFEDILTTKFEELGEKDANGKPIRATKEQWKRMEKYYSSKLKAKSKDDDFGRGR